MNRNLILLLAAVLLCSCGGSGYTVTGRYELAPGDSVYLFASDYSQLAAGIMGADTTVSLKGTVTTPDLVFLANADRINEPAGFFLEPGKIRIERYDPSLGYIVSGTPLNDRKKAFDEAMLAFSDKFRNGSPGQTIEDILAQMDALYARTVDATLDNVFGAWVFSKYQFQNIKNDPEKVKAQLTRFSPEMQAHPMLKRLKVQAKTVERTAIGKPYTDLALKNTAGETVALSSLAGPGRWVLLDFWATWCQPCMMEIPHLKKAYEAYKEKGFEIYGVSLDDDLARWKTVVSTEGMSWTNVILGNGEGPDPTALYDISSIPANFLISPDGVIAAKNLRGEQLEEKLAEVLR